MNRTQERLFKKQCDRFAKTFSKFSVYQLQFIRDLISDIIARKEDDNKCKMKKKKKSDI